MKYRIKKTNWAWVIFSMIVYSIILYKRQKFNEILVYYDYIRIFRLSVLFIIIVVFIIIFLWKRVEIMKYIKVFLFKFLLNMSNFYINVIIMSFFIGNVINSLLIFIVIYTIINLIVIIWLRKLIFLPSLFIAPYIPLVIFMMTKTELYKEYICAVWVMFFVVEKNDNKVELKRIKV